MAVMARMANRDSPVSLEFLAGGVSREPLGSLVHQEIQEKVASIPKV
jgi:hypothetical protein